MADGVGVPLPQTGDLLLISSVINSRVVSHLVQQSVVLKGHLLHKVLEILHADVRLNSLIWK